MPGSMNQINTIMNSVSSQVVQQMMKDAPAATKAEYQGYFGKLFMARISMAVLEALKPADRAEYKAMFIDQQPPSKDAAVTFLRERLPNLTEVLSKEAEAFIKEGTQASVTK